MSRAKKKAVASPIISSGKDDYDVGALIYRESRLRKAVAAAAEGEKISSASTHHRTSTRKRSPVINQGEKSLPSPQRKCASKRKERETSVEEDLPRKKEVAKKKYRYRYECSSDGCINHVQKGGLRKRHGASTKI